MKRKISLWRLLPPALSLLLALGASTVFKACAPTAEGTWMHCHTAQTAAALGSLVLAAVLLAAAFLPGRGLRAALYGLSVLGAAALFWVPGTLVSMCMMHTMRCYTALQPFVRVMAALTGLAALGSLVLTLREDKR